MPPQRSDLVLSSDIPNGEGNVLVFNSLDVEADCWNGSDDFSELQLVKDGRLSGRVQTNHENAHLLLAEQALQNPAKVAFGKSTPFKEFIRRTDTIETRRILFSPSTRDVKLASHRDAI